MGEQTYRKRLSVCHWNIEGFKNAHASKFEDPEFISELSQHDIVGLSEIHAGKDDILGLPEFTTFTSCRSKHKNARKYSGGVAILVKNFLKPGIEIKRSSPDLIWAKLDKSFFGLQENMFVGVVYISPHNSNCTREISEKVWHDLERDIEKYSFLGKVMLLGDFNARTGVVQGDHIVHDDTQYTPTDETYRSDEEIMYRNNMDTYVNEYGRRLLELCRNARLRIVNGRVLGDTTGRMTCYQWNGSSVVDYCIADEDLLGAIEYFKVHELKGTLSNHCKISLQIPSCIRLSSGRQQMYDIPKRVKWCERVSNAFISNLKTEDAQMKIKSIENDIEINTVNESVERITNVLIEALPNNSASCKRKNKSKGVKKKWYDSDCRVLRRSVNNANRKLVKCPWDLKVRENFFILRKEYKKLLSFKERKFKEDLINKINDESCKETKHFWEIVDELKSLNSKINARNVTQFIPGEMWYDHFNKLLSKKETVQEAERSEILRRSMKIMESENGCSVLNEDIRDEEVSKALRSLKNGKSCGLDTVTNEMLKVSNLFCLRAYCKLFNRILKSGDFPVAWMRSIIVPLHKAGNCHDPNNYRGLAINSCFGKLFTTILNNRLKTFVTKNNTIDKHQIGFTEKSQTIDHMLVIKTLADKYKHEGKKLFLGFVDFRKAYDTVWRDGLFFKLLSNGINGRFFKVVKSMYGDSEMGVKVGDKRTAFFGNNIGVKQGEVMSPLLFNIYINDIVKNLKDDDSPRINDSQVDCLLYADDLVILSTSEEGLQRKLNKLENYCATWRLGI